MLASWSIEQQKKFLDSLTPDETEYLEHDWSFWGRPDQQMPTIRGWFIWLIISGRGWGKTRTAVENISQMLRGPTPHMAPKGAPKFLTIIADSPKDMREYSIEGPSGFLNVGPAAYRPLYEPSKSTLTWANGAKAVLYSAEDPESLRGASGSFFWWDELAKSRYAALGWENLMYGMRESNPRGIVTTTPKPLALLRALIAKSSTIVTKGSTWDNKENLSGVYFKEVIAPRVGTRLGRQEIDGEILEEFEGALWDSNVFDKHRVTLAQVPDLQRVVVAVDPSGGGDLKGIIAAGLGVDGRGYVLADRTCALPPNGWGRRAVTTYSEFMADCIVAEVNFGGEMVRHVIATVDEKVPYKELRASRGKVARAEPVSALYEQGRVSHVGTFNELEDQCTQMTSNGFEGDGSPDRVDALVWALTELMLGEHDDSDNWEMVQVADGTFDWRRKGTHIQRRESASAEDMLNALASDASPKPRPFNAFQQKIDELDPSLYGMWNGRAWVIRSQETPYR